MTMRLRLCVLTLAMLAGCADMPGRPSPDTEPGRAAMRQAAAALLDGIRQYDNGNFRGAIAALGTPAMQAAPDAMRVEALKYTAFSYCVMEDYAPCRHAFDRSLAIDPGFELGRSERGHPMWGPVFEAAKAASEQERKQATAVDERERWRGIDLWRAR
jgi:hypothetical protein